MRALLWSLVVKRELSPKAKLSIYWSIFAPTLSYGHEIWKEWGRGNKWMKLISFGGWLGSALEIGWEVRPSGGNSEPSGCPSASKGVRWSTSGIWLGCFVAAFLWRFSGYAQLGEGPRADPEHAGGIIYPIWPGRFWGPPGKVVRVLLRREMSGFLSWNCFLSDLTSDKQKAMDWWIIHFFLKRNQWPRSLFVL